MSEKGILLVLSGPSGVGKNTVLKSFRERLPEVDYSISATTRAPRPGEVDGRDYHFLSREDFLRRKRAGDFLEWAQVYDDYYGTPLTFIREKLHVGKDIVLDLDVQGALKVRRSIPDAVLVFLLPPSLDVLKARLTGRGTENEASCAKRLNYVASELSQIKKYDYVIINDYLDRAVEQVVHVWSAEKRRIERLNVDHILQPFFTDLPQQ